jgi:hypothetical protein
MKTKIILVATVFAALISSAQTNSIIFPQLLSPTNSVLMTNAEFRCFSGNRIIFKNDDGYQTFNAPDLNTNVLAALHTTTAQLDLNQKLLEAKNQHYNDQVSAQLAEMERQKQLKIQHAQAEINAQIRLNEWSATNGRKGWDGKKYNDNQSTGNFIGN